MKNKFFFLPLLLIFISCSQIEPVLSDVCTITNEICFYATAICNNIDTTNVSKSELISLQTQLESIAKDLRQRSNKILYPSSLSTNLSSPDTKIFLTNVRDQLKAISKNKNLLEKK